MRLGWAGACVVGGWEQAQHQGEAVHWYQVGGGACGSWLLSWLLRGAWLGIRAAHRLSYTALHATIAFASRTHRSGALRLAT